ncbi:hypothetical protein [Pelomonas aquatica]|jgi:hypothetical protein|uniref:Uncharacterized protein n=1 Tax=Pelomonas aquatica TaxID=431058 RepID=A0A9X4R668_9BURK|nr:hypothetical protein [Pelomonas aquatica]MCY4756705.1 hypothetical protein [Pelomonas aquatica]MDG0863999.1 hypothetical protein [Pelomonas aquatica]
MHIPYVRKTKENRRSRWVTEDGFRLMRWATPDDNLRRFKRHVERAVKLDRRTASGRRFEMKLRRIRRQAEAT